MIEHLHWCEMSASLHTGTGSVGEMPALTHADIIQIRCDYSEIPHLQLRSSSQSETTGHQPIGLLSEQSGCDAERTRKRHLFESGFRRM